VRWPSRPRIRPRTIICQRVRVYAVEVGKELKIENQARWMLCKPQPCCMNWQAGDSRANYFETRPPDAEEFEKMKIHPTGGAGNSGTGAIPVPGVPIVRAHHEKFDGTGYPMGLKGTEIPMAPAFCRRSTSWTRCFGRQYGGLSRWPKRWRGWWKNRGSLSIRRGTGAGTEYEELEQWFHQRTDSLGKTEVVHGSRGPGSGRNGELPLSPTPVSRRKTAAAAGAQLSQFDRGGAAGSADAVRTQPGPGGFAQSGRNAFRICGETAPRDALRRDCHLRPPRR